MTRVHPQDALAQAIAMESYDYLTSYAPYLLDAVEAAVQQGMSPHQIGRYVRKELGADRVALALRCEQAAAHVVAQQAK
jgi:hypothetical protein